MKYLISAMHYQKKNHLDVSAADEVEITYTEKENSSVIHPQQIKKQG